MSNCDGGQAGDRLAHDRAPPRYTGPSAPPGPQPNRLKKGGEGEEAEGEVRSMA